MRILTRRPLPTVDRGKEPKSSHGSLLNTRKASQSPTYHYFWAPNSGPPGGSGYVPSAALSKRINNLYHFPPTPLNIKLVVFPLTNSAACISQKGQPCLTRFRHGGAGGCEAGHRPRTANSAWEKISRLLPYSGLSSNTPERNLGLLFSYFGTR